MAGHRDTQERLSLRNKEFLSEPVEHHLEHVKQIPVNIRKSKRRKIQNQKRFKVNLTQSSISSSEISLVLESPSRKSEKFVSIISLLGHGVPQADVLEGLRQTLIQSIEAGDTIRPEHVSRLIYLLEYTTDEESICIFDILINLSYLYEQAVLSAMTNKVIPVISKFYKTENETLFCNLIWFIGNTLNYHKNLKEVLLRNKYIEQLIEQLKEDISETTIEIIVWQISFTVKDYILKESDALVLLQRIHHFLRYCNDDIKRFSVAILFYLGSQNEKYLDVCFLKGIILAALPSLKSTNNKLVYNILKLVSCCTSCRNESFTNQLLSISIFSYLSFLSNHSNSVIKKIVFFCYSNIAAGTRKDRKALIEDCYFNYLLNGLSDQEFSVAYEAAIYLKNLAKGINEPEFKALLNQGFFTKLAKLIRNHPEVFEKIGEIVLESIYMMLKNAARSELLELAEFEAALRTLLDHPCGDQVDKIISDFFSDPAESVTLSSPHFFNFS